MSRTRQEHIEWAKGRAVEYVDQGDLFGAFASLASDLTKHPETHSDATEFLLSFVGLPYATRGDDAGLRRFIDGFH